MDRRDEHVWNPRLLEGEAAGGRLLDRGVQGTDGGRPRGDDEVSADAVPPGVQQLGRAGAANEILRFVIISSLDQGRPVIPRPFESSAINGLAAGRVPSIFPSILDIVELVATSECVCFF